MDNQNLVEVVISMNGKPCRAMVEPRQLLVHFIRNQAGLTGTHVGCDTSYCGACTVLLDGKTVKSCNVFAVQADGLSVRTVEGLGSQHRLHALQESFSDNHALQCGYCTPGMLMSALYLLQTEADINEKTVRKALAGNVCRCTGYQNIINAVIDAAERLKGATA